MKNRILNKCVKALLDIDWVYDDSLQETRIHDIIQFSQTWESTALGFEGMGGAMMTTAPTTIVYHSCGVDVYFNGRRAYRIAKPNDLFATDVAKRRMKSIEYAEQYEIKE